MNRNRVYFFFAVIITVFSSCIEFFHPDLGGTPARKYVVDGQVTDQEGYQTVYLSTTSSLEMPNINTLSNCDVKIIDNNGNEFKLEEFKWGQYRVWMKQADLQYGNSYKLRILTPSGIEIVSDFDQMPESPEVDSIYFERRDYPTTDPLKVVQGIQFYVDFDRKNTNSHYYRWEIDETWEHHSVYPITWYLGKKNWELASPPDYSRFVCYTTERMKDIFTLSTENIVQNKFHMQPLQIVDNLTQKLTFCYSSLVYQYAISKEAFKYWDMLRINNSKQGGLYSPQPLRIKGNLKSTTNPELEVLGFFSASSIKTKRIIIRNVENFNVCEPSCAPPYIPHTPEPHKYEIAINGVRYIIIDACVECDYMSGSTVKPSYWPI